MEIIKSYINSHLKRLFILSSLIVLSLFLLMIRLKLTHTFFYLFLVWNLFLAIIPFGIGSFLKEQNDPSDLSLIMWSIVWLLFLPNAPYIVTDLIHLQLSPPEIVWYDALVIISFAVTGLLLFYFSLTDMKKILEDHFKIFISKYIQIVIFGLVSFGVYLGRFLRFNSWDILSNTFNLIMDISNIIFHPFQHISAWLFTIFFGSFLCLGNFLYERLYSNPST